MSFVSVTPYQLSGRYAERNKWENLKGAGDSRPTGEQIIEDENLKGAWKGKVVLITGVNQGVGDETVMALELTGADIYCTTDDVEKSKDVLGTLLVGDRVQLLPWDPKDLHSVTVAAELFMSKSAKLNVLINNDVMQRAPVGRTKQNHEIHFGVNHLAHFALFAMLHEMMVESSTPSFHSRVVNVSHAAHRYLSQNPLKYNLRPNREHVPILAYGSSKLANLWMANQIERLYASNHLHGISLHAGYYEDRLFEQFAALGKPLSKEENERDALKKPERLQRVTMSREQACATIVYAACSSEIEGKGGIYLEGCSTTVHPCSGRPPFDYGYASWAFNQEGEEMLWNKSKEYVTWKEPEEGWIEVLV